MASPSQLRVCEFVGVSRVLELAYTLCPSRKEMQLEVYCCRASRLMNHLITSTFVFFSIRTSLNLTLIPRASYVSDEMR